MNEIIGYLVPIFIVVIIFGGALIIQWISYKIKNIRINKQIIRQREIRLQQEFAQMVYNAGYRRGVLDEKHRLNIWKEGNIK